MLVAGKMSRKAKERPGSWCQMPPSPVGHCGTVTLPGLSPIMPLTPWATVHMYGTSQSCAIVCKVNTGFSPEHTRIFLLNCLLRGFQTLPSTGRGEEVPALGGFGSSSQHPLSRIVFATTLRPNLKVHLNVPQKQYDKWLFN